MSATSKTTLRGKARRRMQRYFARRIVYPWERPGIMRKHIFTGAMGSLYFTLVSGIFFVYFCRQIGLSRFQMGLMGAVASFMLSAQLLSAPLTQWLGGRRKWLWFWCAVIHRGVRVSGVLLAFLLWRWGVPGACVVLLLAVWVAGFFSALAFPPWMSWLGDIIPRREHGGFWGRRSAWIALSVMLVTVPCAILMDVMPEEHKVAAAAGVFLFAGVVGMVDIVIHGTIPEPRMALAEKGPILPQVLEPIRDRGFRSWLIFNVCWTFGMVLGGSLSWLYLIEELGVQRSFLGGTIVTTCLMLTGGIFTSRWSGRLVDRHGPRRVLRWGHLGWSILPLFWLLAPRDSVFVALVFLGGASIVGGIACNAAITAANKLIIRYPRPEKVAMYAAVSSCLGSLAGGLGALTAGCVLWFFEKPDPAVAQAAVATCVGGMSGVPGLAVVGHMVALFKGSRTVLASGPIVGFYIIFIASLVMRLGFTLLLTGRIKDPDPDPEEPPRIGKDPIDDLD